MTKNNTKDEIIENKPKTINKRMLVELVAESPVREFKIIGALARAGLLSQYEHEKAVYGKFDIEPSITEKEFDKIISDFLGN